MRPRIAPRRAAVEEAALVTGWCGKTEAIPLFERVLTDAEQLMGGDHPFTLLARSNLTTAYEADGRWN